MLELSILRHANHTVLISQVLPKTKASKHILHFSTKRLVRSFPLILLVPVYIVYIVKVARSYNLSNDY